MRILFILCDALRYDYFREHMPNLNLFSEKCLNYTHATSLGSTTKQSLPGLLRGKKTLYEEWHRYEDTDNLIVNLNNYGYETSIIYSSPVVHEFTAPFKTKIDLYTERYGGLRTWIRRKIRKTLIFSLLNRFIVRQGYNRAEAVTDRALEYLDEAPEDFFLWVHYMDTHIPWNPPEYKPREAALLSLKLRRNHWKKGNLSEKDIELAKELYSEECKYLDSHLIRLLQTDVDYIIITADHGDLLGEYGCFSHPNMKVPELLHVPLLIYGENNVGRVDSPYSLRKLRGRIQEWARARSNDEKTPSG